MKLSDEIKNTVPVPEVRQTEAEIIKNTGIGRYTVQTATGRVSYNVRGPENLANGTFVFITDSGTEKTISFLPGKRRRPALRTVIV